MSMPTCIMQLQVSAVYSNASDGVVSLRAAL